MAKKLSASKINKIMEYKNAGYTQHQAAAKLHVNQSTVCHYYNQFDDYAKHEGLEAASDKYGGGDVTELNSLAAEIKKEGISIPEAKSGLKLHQYFTSLGVTPDNLGEIVKACQKINEKGFMDAAAELVKLEAKTGNTGLELIKHLSATAKTPETKQAQLNQTHQAIGQANEKLILLNKQINKAKSELDDCLEKNNLTFKRLAYIEWLASKLNQAGIPDEDIELYLQRQNALDEAKLSLKMLSEIITRAKMFTMHDGGKKLLGELDEYGSLTQACNGLEANIKSRQEQLTGLEQQAALKTKLEMEVTKLRTHIASLEPYAAELGQQYQTWLSLNDNVACLTAEKQSLEAWAETLKQQYSQLETAVRAKKAEVADLDSLKLEHDNLLKEVASLKSKRDGDSKRWQVFQGFLGLVASSSREELIKTAAILPDLVASLPKDVPVKQVDFYKNYLIRDLTPKNLSAGLECKTCGLRFIMDNYEPGKTYHCPNQTSIIFDAHEVEDVKDYASLLIEALLPDEATKTTMPKKTPTITMLSKPCKPAN